MEYDAQDTEGWVTVPQSSSWSNLFGVNVSVSNVTNVTVGAVSDRRRELDAVSALLQAGGSCASDVKNYSNCLNIQKVRMQRNSAE